MAGKQIILTCEGQQASLLCDAIRLYVEAAYPPGGSECGQVARQALLDAACSIEKQCDEQGQAVFSRRLRSQFKAALEYFAEAANINNMSNEHIVMENIKALLAGNN